MRILGTVHFPEDHFTTNISDKVMDLRLEFGVYPKNSEGKTPQCPDVVSLDTLLCVTLESD